MLALAEIVAHVVRRVIGVPDYEAYLAHLRRHHPQAIPMPQDEFTREALSRRYSQPGSRCC